MDDSSWRSSITSHLHSEYKCTLDVDTGQTYFAAGDALNLPVAEEILQQNGWGPAREFGNLGNLGSKKIPKIKILKIKIRVAQNVGKVWISRKKQLPAPFGAIPGHFLRGPEKSKKCWNFAYFPWWANGPYSPGLGKWLQYFFCHP